MPFMGVLVRVFAFLVIFASGAWAYAPADDVARALDAYEARVAAIPQPGTASQRRPVPRDVPRPRRYLKPPQPESPAEEPRAGGKVHETQMGLETYGYKYLETVEGEHFMDLKGRFAGFFLTHTFRPDQLNPFVAGNFFNMFRFDIRYAQAKLNYTGGVQFGNGDSVPLSMRGVPDRVCEGRLILGKDMAFHGLTVTPFSGIGIRGLEDDASKVTGVFDNGGVPETISGYKRVSRYYYIPLGLEVEKRFLNTWRARLNMEYDVLLSGMQTSHAPGDIVYQGQTYHYDAIKNKQPKGYGVRASLNLQTDVGRWGFFVEPFYRFWDIEDSDLAHVRAGGYEFIGIAMEPSNTTREIGMRMGMVF